MNLEEFYNNIETPLNETGIKAIIDLYCLEGNLYNNIIDFIHNPYVLPSGKEYDEYYLYMFNTWKNKITNMSRNAFKVLREKGKVENDFIILRKYLNELEEPKSAYEVKEIMNNSETDFKLFYTDIAIDVTNHTNPIRIYLNERYINLGPSFMNKLDLFLL